MLAISTGLPWARISRHERPSARIGGPWPHFVSKAAPDCYAVWMDKRLKSLLLFVALLVVLNFFFSEMDYGVHISIVGSLVLTFVISAVMNMGGGSRGS